MIAKHPPELEEGRFAASAGKPVSRSQICAHCNTPVPKAATFVNDPNGPSGWFHLDCYPAAKMGHVSVEARHLHADLESTVGSEYRALECIAP